MNPTQFYVRCNHHRTVTTMKNNMCQATSTIQLASREGISTQVLAAGDSAYLNKPLDEHTLLSAVTEAVRGGDDPPATLPIES